MKMFKDSVKMMALAVVFMVTQGQAAEQSSLGVAFLGQGKYLQRVREIQSRHLNQTEFMPELQPLVEEIVNKVREKIDQTPALNQNLETMKLFEKMGQYAKNEFSNNTMNLNRLNYLCLQMSILLNPNLNKPFEILADFNMFVNVVVPETENTKVWHLSYDEACEAFQGYIENMQRLEQEKILETGKELEIKGSVEAESLFVNALQIGGRGMNVYPLVAGLPFFGIKTHLEAFAEQMTLVGYPLDEKFEAHSGLIGKGEYAYCPWHDILHLESTAPSLHPLKNYAHIKAMTQVIKSLLPMISEGDTTAQKKDLITLFLAIHELVDYSKNQFVLLEGEMSQKDVLTRMFEHATMRLAEEIPASLDNKEQYYREVFKMPGDLRILNYYEEGGREEIPECPNLGFNAKHFIVVTGGRTENEIGAYSGDDFLEIYENARLFSYSIVKLYYL